jgi:predicted murein hydrolase (TIGR00659 family)
VSGHLATGGWVLFTLASYLGARAVCQRFRHPLLNPFIVSAGVVLAVLIVLGIPFKDYAPAKEAITVLLGPATVGLAVPLYRHRLLLRRYLAAIAGSVALGALVALLSAGWLARIGGLPGEVVASILPKGVTIPFAVEIAAMYGGIPPLAAAFVVATGTLGALAGIWMLNVMGIREPVSRGLALGTMCHAQGTALALMENDLTGAMAGLAMILAGIITAALAPLGAWLLL